MNKRSIKVVMLITCTWLCGGCYALFVLPENVCSRGDWVALHTDAYVLLFEPYLEQERERRGVSAPATQPASMPATQPASMPATQPASMPATQPTESREARITRTFIEMYESFIEMRELGRELRMVRREKNQRAGRRRVIFAWDGDFKPVAGYWGRCNALAKRTTKAFKAFDRASLAYMRALAGEER
jgi:hypothetical protein